MRPAAKQLRIRAAITVARELLRQSRWSRRLRP